MQETAQQYTQRILGYVAGQEPLKVQAVTPSKLERLADRASAEELRKRPAPDKWSIGEILAHLADVEIVVGWRVRSILGAPGTAIQAFDQDSWVVAGHYDQRNPSESVALFRAARTANLTLYKSLSAEQWKHYGIHSERGQETIEQVVRMIAGHDLNHLQQIERILAAKPPGL
jgi:DinB superfamily